MELLSMAEIFRIKRYYFRNCKLKEIRSVKLHGFCDASKDAIAAVIYINGLKDDGDCTQEFVLCKTKVTPMLKPGEIHSMPKLELRGCDLLGASMAYVRNSLQNVVCIKTETCWSDSLDALFWIKDEKRKRKVFIENRVKRIRKNTPVENWRYCPGELNPADLPSRGIGCEKEFLEKMKDWVRGPEFIRRSEKYWPEDKSASQKETDLHVKRQEGRDEGPENIICNMLEISNITPRVIPQLQCLYISHIDESGTSSKGFQLRYPMTSFPEVDKVITIEHYNDLRKLLVKPW